MLLEAIFGIIAISVVFCCCTLCCYVLFHYIFTEGKEDIQPEPEVWEAKHFYDPLPMATPSPPDNIFKPTPYTFKLQNGNGIYSSGLPHAVINPEVLQYPPGHIFDQQCVLPPQPPPVQVISRHERRANKESSRRSKSKSKSHSHSRSPSPGRSPRGTQNVWSTNTEFQQPHNYYQNSQRHHHQQQQQHSHPPPQQRSQKQYVQLTQDQYPLHHRPRQDQQQQYQNMQPQLSEEYYHHQRYDEREQNSKRNPLHRQHSQQFEAFMATTHATNVYTPTSKRKLHRSKSRLKEDVT